MNNNRMFSFITKTFNPLSGACQHECAYCWARKLIEKYQMPKYQGIPTIDQKQMHKTFTKDDFVFMQDMSDLMADNVPNVCIRQILNFMQMSPARFLLMTKNPKRYLDLLDWMPSNVALGCTIESNIDYPWLSKAPSQSDRLVEMTVISEISSATLFISIEPILEFTDEFKTEIEVINPWAVAIGYSNYPEYCWLPEPPLEKTRSLIESLRKAGITVYEKTMREAMAKQEFPRVG